MARANANKLYRTFTKGLITEAGYLTYPENASTDELNTVIKPKGSRSRRFGIDFEVGAIGKEINMTETSVVSEYGWKTVANDSSINFLALQTGSRVYFFDMDAETIGNQEKNFSVNLLNYKTDSATDADVENTPVQMTSGKGFLFIVQEHIEPIVVEYDPDTDTISILKIIIQVRDFDGVDDGLANDEQPSTLSKEHLYNLKNQGWQQPYTATTTGGGTVTDSGQQRFFNPRTGTDGVYQLDNTP